MDARWRRTNRGVDAAGGSGVGGCWSPGRRNCDGGGYYSHGGDSGCIDRNGVTGRYGIRERDGIQQEEEFAESVEDGWFG